MKRVLLLVLCAATFSVQAQDKPSPCDNENNNAFDFFVGEWRVTAPDGAHAGDSTIDKIQNGCVVRENWRSGRSDYTGTSFNFYNKEADQWEQIWLDNKGERLHLKGHKEAEQMILRSDQKPDKEGHAQYNQITWTDNQDGSVRQLWEVITEDKAPSVLFDGLYKAVK